MLGGCGLSPKMNLVSAWRMSDPVRLDGTAIMVMREWLLHAQYLVALMNAATMGARIAGAATSPNIARTTAKQHMGWHFGIRMIFSPLMFLSKSARPPDAMRPIVDAAVYSNDWKPPRKPFCCPRMCYRPLISTFQRRARPCSSLRGSTRVYSISSSMSAKFQVLPSS